MEISSLQTRTKLVCAVLSLPVPPDSKNHSGAEVNGVIPDNLDQKSLRKLLLVGYDKSGTSTIYKQVKILMEGTNFTSNLSYNLCL